MTVDIENLKAPPTDSIGDYAQFHTLLDAMFEASNTLDAACGREVFDASDNLTAAQNSLIDYINTWANRRAATAAGTVEKDARRRSPEIPDNSNSSNSSSSSANQSRETAYNRAKYSLSVIREHFDAGWDAAIEAHKSGKDATVPAAAGSIRPAPGEQVQRERRRFPESGSE